MCDIDKTSFSSVTSDCDCSYETKRVIFTIKLQQIKPMKFLLSNAAITQIGRG